MYSFSVKRILAVVWICVIIAVCDSTTTHAHHDERYYNVGAPVYTDIWVDPMHGHDSNDGLTADTALAHIATAWERIPTGAPLTLTGYRILLQPGSYDATQIPAGLQGRTGTAQYPIEIRATSGSGSVTLTQPLDIQSVAYLYIYDITVAATPAVPYALSCHECSHVVVRTSTFAGGGIIATQSDHIAIEDSLITNGPANGIQFTAVRDSHIQNTRVQSSTAACVQFNAGSATIRIEASTLTACGTYGVVIGPESTLESMRSPWIHYDAYDVTIANSIIMQTNSAGIGVYGGYNIAAIYNTLYDVGGRTTALAFGHARRKCAGIIAPTIPSCSAQLIHSGWGTNNDTSPGEPIPNRNVYVYNNIVVNPAGTQNQAHFTVAPGLAASAYSGIARPSSADNGLQIIGNIIWNGATTLPLGIEKNSGCMVSNTTCNATQLRTDNRINVIAPLFVDVAAQNMRLQASLPAAVSIPPLPDNRPVIPRPPLAAPSNAALRDMRNIARPSDGLPGAFATLSDSATQTPQDDIATVTASTTPARNTATMTKTPSLTRTATSSHTATSTRTFTWTKTASVTATPSNTRTNSATRTASITHITNTATATLTANATLTYIRALSATSTRTPSSTRTSTITHTPYLSSTASQTRTGTQTYTSTVTRTHTLTRTITLTRTSTRTPTRTATRTSSTRLTPVTPVIPRIHTLFKRYLRDVYIHGQRLGNHPNTFAKIGDSITASPNFLNDIGCGGENIATYTGLQDTITFFRQYQFTPSLGTGWCNTSNSFTAHSPSAIPGWNAYYPILTEYLMPGYASICKKPYNTPIGCEVGLKRPSIAFIMYGSNDVTNGQIDNFITSLGYLIDYCLEQGVIPVVSTIPPRLDNPIYRDRVSKYNTAIAQLADAKRVPLWNYWAALQSPEMINYGMSADGIHPSVYGTTQSADFSREGLRYGYNQRNLTAIQMLDTLRRIVILNGPPDP